MVGTHCYLITLLIVDFEFDMITHTVALLHPRVPVLTGLTRTGSLTRRGQGRKEGAGPSKAVWDREKQSVF